MTIDAQCSHLSSMLLTNIDATFHWLITGANTRVHNFQDELSLLLFRYSTFKKRRRRKMKLILYYSKIKIMIRPYINKWKC
jgi:hypothetical protein